MNHENYQQRLDFIHATLQEHFDLKSDNLEPLEYDSEGPFPYNNFIYRVILSSPTTSSIHHASLPGTLPIPAGTTTLVMRLSNAQAMGINQEKRIENEVATIELVRKALAHLPSQIVPAVYGWASAADGQGWILLEHMKGEMLNTTFPDFDLETKRGIVAQMAQVQAALQKFRIPESVRGYGGLTYDDEGSIFNAPMTVLDPKCAGPFETYGDMYKAFVQTALIDADASSVVNGWRADGVRDRLEKFVESAVVPICEKFEAEKKVLVHADFTTWNLLWDSTTKQVTALLDFDFSHIGTAADEYMRSFGPDNGSLPGPYSDKEEDVLRQTLLHGLPDPIPASTESVDWALVKVWDEERSRAGVRRPVDIPGIDKLSEVQWLVGQIAPFRLCCPAMVLRRNDEQRKQDREKAEMALVRFLDDRGY